MNSEGKITNIKSNGLLGHIVALVVVMIWGGTFVNTRVLIDKGLSPEEIYVLRTLLAYVCIWFISPKKLFCDSLKDELVVFLLGIFGSSLYFLTENYALKLAVVNDVSFIVCTTPLVTSLGVAVLEKCKSESSACCRFCVCIVGRCPCYLQRSFCVAP